MLHSNYSIAGLVLLSCCASVILATGKKVVLCYIDAKALRRPGWGNFTVLDTDTKHCTHIVYAFMGLNENKNTVKYLDNIIDTDLNGFKQNQVSKMKILKAKNPNVKLLVSIGGYSEKSIKFSNLARDPKKRKIFISNIKEFLKDNLLDGLDFCWQFPGERGGRPEDKVNSVLLFRELKEAFKTEGLLLTVHILAHPHVMDDYNIEAVSNIVDFINLAAFEYNGPWRNKTGIFAPLMSKDDYNVVLSVDSMIRRGADRRKILLGLPMYGHAYLLKTPVRNNQYIGLDSEHTFSSTWTKKSGIISYYEMCINLKNSEGWIEHWDTESYTPVSFKDKMFVSYENKRSLLLKADLVSSKSLGGVMIWTLDLDDFRGVCYGENFPLLTAITDFINTFSTKQTQPELISPEMSNSTKSEDILNEFGQVILCYIVSWAAQRHGEGKFSVLDAKNDYCTHIVYAFLLLDPTTSNLTPADSYIREELLKLKTLKKWNSNLKILASVGGGGLSSKNFSDMADSPWKRELFISSLESFLKRYEFDGIDICWKYPGSSDGKPDDRWNLIKLLKEIKAAFKPNKYLLTLHVLGHHYSIDAYEIKIVSDIVDFINFATMDYHGGWERTLSVSTPLTSSDNANVKASLDYILSKGVSPKKILLGLPTYGHAYTLPEHVRDSFIGQEYDQLFTSNWTREPGLIGYNELCYKFAFPDGIDEWTEEWEPTSQTPIAYTDKIFATYENARSLTFKAKLAEQKKLAGVMIWSLDMDDFRGICDKRERKKYPLISAVSAAIDSWHQSPAVLRPQNISCINVSASQHSVIASCEYGKK